MFFGESAGGGCSANTQKSGVSKNKVGVVTSDPRIAAYDQPEAPYIAVSGFL